MLISGISEERPELVRRAIGSGQLKLETLNVALAAVLAKKGDDIVQMIERRRSNAAAGDRYSNVAVLHRQVPR